MDDDDNARERIEALTLNFTDTDTRRINYQAMFFEFEKHSKSLNNGVVPRRDMLILEQLNNMTTTDQSLRDHYRRLQKTNKKK